MHEEVRKAFRPEFINRLDEIVVFHRLGRTELRRIVDIQLGRLEGRLAKRELHLELTDAAKDWLGAVGWDPQYGARPLKRAIRKHLEDALAKQVISGSVLPGSRILVDKGAGEELVFQQHEQN